MTQAGRDQHPSHSDLQPSLWLDHDVSLRRNRRLQPLEELHGFRVIGGVPRLLLPPPPTGPAPPPPLRPGLVPPKAQPPAPTGPGRAGFPPLNPPPPRLS